MQAPKVLQHAKAKIVVLARAIILAEEAPLLRLEAYDLLALASLSYLPGGPAVVPKAGGGASRGPRVGVGDGETVWVGRRLDGREGEEIRLMQTGTRREVWIFVAATGAATVVTRHLGIDKAW